MQCAKRRAHLGQCLHPVLAIGLLQRTQPVAFDVMVQPDARDPSSVAFNALPPRTTALTPAELVRTALFWGVEIRTGFLNLCQRVVQMLKIVGSMNVKTGEH